MKPTRAICGIAVVLILFIENVASTILASTLLTGFVGGFLMGNITLGSLLTAMNALSRPQAPVKATTATGTQAKVVSRGSSSEVGSYNDFDDIPLSVESQVRDRFLRQLGKMDPLNCLPKVFCEITADPEAASSLFGSGAFGQNLAILSSNTAQHLQTLSASKSKKKPKKSPKPSYNDEPQDDEPNDDDEDTSDSQSDEEEGDEPYNEEEAKFKAYEAKEAYNLESKALEEMMDELHDPIGYYFVLKDKKKNLHPKLQGYMQNSDFSRRSFGPNRNSDSVLSKKIGEAYSIPVEETEPTTKRPRGSSLADDIFADDPFFDDFSRSLKFPSAVSEKPELSKVALLRRSRREVDVLDEHDITMAKYRMAAKIAQKYKDPSKCQRVFSTCPFSSEEVMSMITKLNSEDQELDTSKQPSSYAYTVKSKPKNKKKTQKDDSLKSLKNTLLAIEKLNDATMLAQESGQPLDYEKLVEEASKSQGSSTSDKIMEDFEQFGDQIETNEETIPTKVIKVKKSKTKPARRLKTNKRQRRHGVAPTSSFETDDAHFIRPKNRRARISVMASKKDKVQGDVPIVPVFASMEEEQEKLNLKKENLESRAGKYSDEDASSSKESTVHLSETIPKGPLVEKEARVADPKKASKSDEAFEDDEEGSPESEEHFIKIPTFSQTFTETVQTPSKTKNRPRPIHPIVKVKPQFLQKTTTAKPLPPSTSSYVVSRRPTLVPQITKHFSGEVEDDEEEANESEKAIDALVSKYKPKDKKVPSSTEA